MGIIIAFKVDDRFSYASELSCKVHMSSYIWEIYIVYTKWGGELNEFQSGKLNETRKDYKGSKTVINDRKYPGENKYTMCRTNLRLLLAERKQK